MRVAEYEGSECAGAADPGELGGPGVQLRAGGQQALLGEVVQGRPGVLPVHAQHGHADRGLPRQGSQCGGEYLVMVLSAPRKPVNDVLFTLIIFTFTIFTWMEAAAASTVYQIIIINRKQ